jgi:hypothetical protein
MEGILWPLVVIAVIGLAFLFAVMQSNSRKVDRDLDKHWDRVEREEGTDPELVAAAVEDEVPALDVEAAFDALAKLRRLEIEARERLEKDRGRAGAVDQEGFHYIVPDDAAPDDVIEAVELRHGPLFASIEEQSEEIGGRLERYFHLRRLRAETMRERDAAGYREEIEQIEWLEERLRRVEDGEET